MSGQGGVAVLCGVVKEVCGEVEGAGRAQDADEVGVFSELGMQGRTRASLLSCVCAAGVMVVPFPPTPAGLLLPRRR
jgi:hypothetical protein